MKISSAQYAQALLEAVSETNPKDHDKVLDKFVLVLKQNGDLGKFDEIEKEYNHLRLKQQGISEAEVTFARDIEMNQNLIKELNKVVSGKTEFKQKIDENLIGGLVIRIDDTLIDASVKTQLKNLNQELKS
jgi:F-type H+-transporting ATPase subunit delta